MLLQCASLTPLHDVIEQLWGILTYPVTKIWLTVLRRLEPDRGMIFILPMFLTQILFICTIGYAIGAVVGRLARTPKGS